MIIIATVKQLTIMPTIKLPPSIAEQTLVKLMRAGDRLWRESDEKFAQWQLTDNHYNVLRILNGVGEPISQIEIGRRMLSSRANVTKLIDRLEVRKFVKRLACGDRRVKLIELTTDGAKFIEETAEQIINMAESTMKPLTKQEQKALGQLLDKLIA